ncbi:MAG: hypothetical protein AB1697_00085 [Pseudomonadota bacterium]
MDELLSELQTVLEQQGWQTKRLGGVLTAEKAIVRARWWLGSRCLTHRLRLQADAGQRLLSYWETAVESSRGLAPPLLSGSRQAQQGWRFDETRRDAGIGSGQLEYGRLREEMEQACRRAGWSFRPLPGGGAGSP